MLTGSITIYINKLTVFMLVIKVSLHSKLNIENKDKINLVVKSWNIVLYAVQTTFWFL